ncbi:hypothetical protein Hs30E_11190 [Lactococcus hodotermopsidis]|uniref:Uncharacterized protein n=1 Tax=Pseudolactococcus hodotermopsidis TaxID=2709157 RepID=A0A6A0BDZ8_9LACT|nr:hypothetical protein [Lactococcus hodotermopsidis]GFH42568.1 hypothetical protein Hs30E_11190 [Lactococcus hodotermopsidis]
MSNQNIRTYRKKFLQTLAISGGLLLLAFSIFPDSPAFKKQNLDIVTAETNNQTPVNLDLTSIQNAREIKLTKFVAITGADKIEFDYQFKLDDEKLKNLLEKSLAAGSNFQDIQFEVFADSNTENIAMGGLSESTFRLEGETYMGSVSFTFDKKTIPEYDSLTLRINNLSWEDYDDYQSALAEATKTNAISFEVPTALRYEGDWSFKVQK